MKENSRKTGIEVVGDAPWGSHFCQFYQTPDDLTNILPLYFKAGLENNEFCLWITSAPLNAEKSQKSIEKVIPDFEQYLDKEQIKIIPHTDWYLEGGVFTPQKVLANWINELKKALAKGYDGMRVAGDTAWVEKTYWRDFIDYETATNKIIGKHNMLSVCAYPLDRCDAFELIEIINNHQFTLIKQATEWKLLENVERRQLKAELRRVRHELEVWIEERSVELAETTKRLIQGTIERKWAGEERRKHERRLQQEKNLNRILLDSMPCIALLMRPKTRDVIASNKAAGKVGAIPGTQCFKTWAKRDEPCPWCLAPEVWADSGERRLEIEDNGLVWDVAWVKIAEDLYLHYAFDITQRKQAEEKIKQLAIFPAETPDPVLCIKKNGYLQFANPAAWPIIVALETKPGEFLPAEWKHLIAEIYHSQNRREIELECRDRIFSIIITPFTGTDFLYAYGRNITEHKQIEKQIQVYQEQLRYLAAELSFAEERERRRIATMLHDHIIQNLGFSKISLEILAETAAGFGHDKHLNSIKELEVITEEMIKYTRSLTFDLSPPILYELGFEVAVEWLIEQIHKRHGILIFFENDGQPKSLDDDIRSLLFQAARELLVNVVKHAQATHVNVFVSRKKDHIKIDIEDNGIGFDVVRISPRMDKNSGFGLFNIRERLHYIGGGLELDSGPGRGTRASLTAPLAIDKDMPI